MAGKAQIEFRGDKELVRDMKTLVNENYNESVSALRRAGNQFKRQLRQKVRSSVRSDTNLTRGFWTSQPTGTKFSEMHVDFAGEGSKNHHWHLIEDGHKLVRPNLNRFKKPYKDAGAVLGHVSGIHSVEELCNSGIADNIIEKEMVTALDRAMAKGNLK